MLQKTRDQPMVYIWFLKSFILFYLKLFYVSAAGSRGDQSDAKMIHKKLKKQESELDRVTVT